MKEIPRKIYGIVYNKTLDFVAYGVETVGLIVRYFEKLIKNMKNKSKHELRSLFYKACIFFFSLVFLVTGASVLWFATTEIPDLSSFDRRVLGESTKIFDRTGKVLLYDVNQNMKRTVIPFEEISPNIKKATLAIEDSDFYTHNGIKLSSIFRAILNNLTDLGYSQGGSTITQQVVKNSLLTKEKKISRKVKEIILSIKLEKSLAKDEIFSLYLNESPYGGTIYGVEEATQSFFGKSAKDITLAEAAYIAAIPQAPTHFSPYGKYREELESRKNLVLMRMKEIGSITSAEHDDALAEKVVFQDKASRGIKAPHFVMYVKQYLEETYGEEVLVEGGLKVITTLDYEMQQKAEEIVKKYALKNEKESDAENGAMVVIDPKTGDVLTMVGSRDYFDETIEGNFNVTTARRQPGSSFKPFVYAKAFELGYTPETVLFDAETQFSSKCKPSDFSDQDGCYSPQNYDGTFRGPISLRGALGGSINVPAVKLLYLVGVQNAMDLAKNMGITTLTDPDQYGLSLVLGGGEVSLLDMTGAYGVFANDGVKNKTGVVLKVEDKKGNVLEEKKEEDGEEVLSKNVSLTISDVLSDNVARTPIFGANSALYIPGRSVAVKTGTTNNFRDAWILGYTPNIVVGAWNGNNDNHPINKKSAGMLVAPMWREFMVEILKDLPNEPFEEPELADKGDIKPILKGDWRTGDVHSILHYVNKENPLGPAPKNPETDSQYEYWEYGVQRWLINNGFGTSSNTGNDEKISLVIVRPDNGDFVEKNSTLPVVVKIFSDYDVAGVDYYLNGKNIGSSNVPPFGLSIVPQNVGAIDGENELRAKVTDKQGNTEDGFVKFTIR
jgi:1A family penicillin-binding protein